MGAYPTSQGRRSGDTLVQPGNAAVDRLRTYDGCPYRNGPGGGTSRNSSLDVESVGRGPEDDDLLTYVEVSGGLPRQRDEIHHAARIGARAAEVLQAKVHVLLGPYAGIRIRKVRHGGTGRRPATRSQRCYGCSRGRRRAVIGAVKASDIQRVGIR